MTNTQWIRWAMVVLACVAATARVQAQIKVGQTAGYTGAVAGSVGEATQGARLYFDAVNARGGVDGQSIQLVALDDRFDPGLTVENAQQLIEQGCIALFLNRGTPHTQAIMPLLTTHRIPLVGPSSGAMALHTPVHPWLFNVRAPYRREAERLIAHLSLIGVDRLAIVQVDDTFGADAVLGALNGLAQVNKQPLAHEKYNRAKPDFSSMMPKIAAIDPQAVLFIGSGLAIVEGMKALRATGSRAQMVTLSNNASSVFVKDLGDLAHGVVVSQVFPYERSIASLLVKEARELAKAANVELTPSMLEGHVAAKVLVEGLRRAGPNPTREKLRRGLETLARFDLGGVDLSFSASDHSGLDYADLSIVGLDGRFRR